MSNTVTSPLATCSNINTLREANSTKPLGTQNRKFFAVEQIGLQVIRQNVIWLYWVWMVLSEILPSRKICQATFSALIGRILADLSNLVAVVNSAVTYMYSTSLTHSRGTCIFAEVDRVVPEKSWAQFH